MPDANLLETFPTPSSPPFVIEHVAEEFTSLCPKTGGNPAVNPAGIELEPLNTAWVW